MIEICAVGAESGYFKIKSILDHNDDAKLCADCVGVRKNLLHDFRQRIRGHIEIFRRKTAHHVAHATAGEIGNVTTAA